MYKNGLTYVGASLFIIAAHGAMLLNVLVNGAYSDIKDVFILIGAVLGLDIVYFISMLFYKQMSFAIDFLLIFILNMSVVFQSCFGGVHLSLKHYLTCIAALVACRAGHLLCRSHKWIQEQKKYFYIGIGILILCILTLTGSRSMWIDLGFMTIQPSEFIKPLLVLACSTSVIEQQRKHRILCFNVVYENLILFGIIVLICGLQWWCRDLGSLPTFVAIYACGLLFRICYPKAKFSKKTVVFGIIALLIIAVIAAKFAPGYVQERLHADIWSDKTGTGYQQSKALIAIAEGGWFGKGPGHGSLYKVFAYESDIVFSTISEEWGLLYALMMIFSILLMLAMPLINPARSYFHSSMAACICAAFTVQMALNIFGSCNLIPFTGVTIPFISQGGSSMVTSGFMIGMLSAAQSPVFKKTKPKKSADTPKAGGGKK
ncbi:MAG: FtsW/RodA/SpoVE family cell cycle protein [Oscillospiraceae bacterium]|nr:FtsW/RodA/SpoVE family cell cycle protein [Oscillospiraceae bacterium]